MCDQISDAVLDAHLKLDPDSKVTIKKDKSKRESLLLFNIFGYFFLIIN